MKKHCDNDFVGKTMILNYDSLMISIIFNLLNKEIQFQDTMRPRLPSELYMVGWDQFVKAIQEAEEEAAWDIHSHVSPECLN